MKKALPYGLTAILLGTVTMVTPLMLLELGYFELMDSRPFISILGRGKETYEEGRALERALSPSNLSSVGLMFIPSFLLALGAFLYLKKRMF